MRNQCPYTVPFQSLAGNFNSFSIHSQNLRKLMAALVLCQEDSNRSCTSSGSSLSCTERSTRAGMNLWMPDGVPGWPKLSGYVWRGPRLQQGQTAAGGKIFRQSSQGSMQLSKSPDAWFAQGFCCCLRSMATMSVGGVHRQKSCSSCWLSFEMQWRGWGASVSLRMGLTDETLLSSLEQKC